MASSSSVLLSSALLLSQSFTLAHSPRPFPFSLSAPLNTHTQLNEETCHHSVLCLCASFASSPSELFLATWLHQHKRDAGSSNFAGNLIMQTASHSESWRRGLTLQRSNLFDAPGTGTGPQNPEGDHTNVTSVIPCSPGLSELFSFKLCPVSSLLSITVRVFTFVPTGFRSLFGTLFPVFFLFLYIYIYILNHNSGTSQST